LFLSSDAASFVNGAVLNVDGGFGAAGLMFDTYDDQTPAEGAQPGEADRGAGYAGENGTTAGPIELGR
jgi:hypothetical protein